MAERLYTTDELLRIIKLPPRTHGRWLSKNYTAPVERGAGRGKSHMWDAAAGLWEMALDELFLLWPKADIQIFLGKVDDSDDFRTPLRLEDGPTIVSYLRKHKNFMRYTKGHVFAFIVALLCGYRIGTDGKPTMERFVEVHVSPLDLALTNIQNFMLGPGFSSSGGDYVRSVSLINLELLNAYFNQEAKRMGI